MRKRSEPRRRGSKPSAAQLAVASAVASHPDAPGVILRTWRESLRVGGRTPSVRAFARMLGMNASTLSRLERPDASGRQLRERHRLALWYLAKQLRVDLPVPLRPYLG